MILNPQASLDIAFTNLSQHLVVGQKGTPAIADRGTIGSRLKIKLALDNVK
jgi:hypothetical protein